MDDTGESAGESEEELDAPRASAQQRGANCTMQSRVSRADCALGVRGGVQLWLTTAR